MAMVRASAAQKGLPVGVGQWAREVACDEDPCRILNEPRNQAPNRRVVVGRSVRDWWSGSGPGG